MKKRWKTAWCCFMAAALLTLLGVSGYRAKAGSSSGVVVQNTSAGMVSLTFDDGYVSAYDYGLPILDAAGLKSTQYIITGSIGQPGYMSQDEVLSMQASGHEIGAHTRTHPHLPKLTPQQMKIEMEGSLQDLTDMGIHATTLAYPYGEYDDKVVAAAKSAGFMGARTITGGFDKAGTAPFLLNSEMVVPDTTSQQINAWIDESQSKGTWLILVFHRIDEDGNLMSATHELLQATVDRLIAKKIHVVTVSQGMDILKLKP